jgi:putative transcriptional regulator
VGSLDVVENTRGQLLIAGPTLLDPNFQRAVVLIVEHSEEGALGLVLNRPSETTVGEAVSELDELVGAEEPLFIGGPVQQSALIVLAEFEDAARAAVVAFEDIGVLGGEDHADPPATRRGRAFAGHAGWGPGQLDSELERGDWILEPARREDAFSALPGGLWQAVLTRKGGSYALVARMPEDPSVN